MFSGKQAKQAKQVKQRSNNGQLPNKPNKPNNGQLPNKPNKPNNGRKLASKPRSQNEMAEKHVTFNVSPEDEAANGLLKLSRRAIHIPCFVKAHRYKKMGTFARRENTCCIELYIEWMSGRHTWENAKIMSNYSFVRDYIKTLEPVAPTAVIEHRLIEGRLDVYLAWSNGEYSWNTIETFPTAPIVEDYLAKYIGLKEFREQREQFAQTT